MKKILLTCFAASLLFSCKKDEKQIINSGLDTNQFKIGNRTYNGSIEKMNNTLHATDSTGNDIGLLTLYFADELPTAEGIYKIVSLKDLDQKDEIGVVTSFSSATTGNGYFSKTNLSNSSAKVTIKEGKVRVEISDLIVESHDKTTEKVSANILQP